MTQYKIIPKCGFFEIVNTEVHENNEYHYVVCWTRYRFHADAVCAALNVKPPQTEAEKRQDYYHKKDERGLTAADYDGHGGPGSSGGICF
jgi:hypothetical protein